MCLKLIKPYDEDDDELLLYTTRKSLLEKIIVITSTQKAPNQHDKLTIETRYSITTKANAQLTNQNDTYARARALTPTQSAISAQVDSTVYVKRLHITSC